MKLVQVKRGTTRIVVLIPCFGIALKIARIEPLVFIRYIIRRLRSIRGICALFHRWQWNPEIILTPGWMLGMGLHANLAEFIYWVRFRNPLVQPTYLSLGFLNIQKLATSLSPDFDVLALFSGLDDERVRKAGHVLCGVENFGLNENQQIKLLDYGASTTRMIATRYGHVVSKRFKEMTIAKAP